MIFPPALSVVLIVVAALLCVGAVLLWIQTYRAPENVPVRILAICITLLAVASVLRGPYGNSALSVPANNSLAILTLAIQLSFFVSVDLGRAGTRRMRWEVAVAAAVSVFVTVVYLLAPAALRDVITNAAPTAGGTVALMFSFPILAYFGYAAGSIIYWIARIMPDVVRGILRFSLYAVAAGAVLQILAAVLKLAALVTRYAGVPVTTGTVRSLELVVSLIVALGFLCLVLGAIVPLTDGAIREIPRMRAQRRANRMLEPLWRALHTEFPELMLELRSPGPGRALYRRVVEIRDGLVLLSPYYDAEVAERAGRASRESGEDADERPFAVQAAVVRRALESRRAGDPAPDRSVGLAEVTATAGVTIDSPQDWQDDAAVLVRLARRFAESPA